MVCRMQVRCSVATIYPFPGDAVCGECQTALGASDRFCRGCGQSLQLDMEEPETPTGQRRPVVLFLLFFVLGPLALKRLWASPEFSTVERIFFSMISLIEVVFIGNMMVQSYISYVTEIANLGMN